MRKSESFLDDIDLKQEAVAWLRKNVQAGRRKPTNNELPVPPLNVPRFQKWVNEELLKETLAADSRRKPICEWTACHWLHVPSISSIYVDCVRERCKTLNPNRNPNPNQALGFHYQNHKKMIYYDGHERRDVKVDRAEKLVMLSVLKEVCCCPAPVESAWLCSHHCSMVRIVSAYFHPSRRLLRCFSALWIQISPGARPL